jgi:hypothetical protein
MGCSGLLRDDQRDSDNGLARWLKLDMLYRMAEGVLDL